MNNICKYCEIENDGVTSFKSMKVCRVCDNNLYRYKLNRLEVLKIWGSQNKSCGICQKALDMFVGNRKDGGHVDHDHETGEVRGILCKQCNSSIGTTKVDLLRHISQFQTYMDNAYGT